ncbi:hypothetical protein [Streptosporangium roseum]
MRARRVVRHDLPGRAVEWPAARLEEGILLRDAHEAPDPSAASA